MNNVTIVGRNTKELEAKSLPSGSKVVNFCIAIDRKTKDDKVTDYIDCVAWGKTADLIAQYVKKGDRLGIVGQITTRTYQDRDGHNRKVTEVLVDRVEFLSDASRTQATAPAPVETRVEDEPQALPVEDEPQALPFEI